MAFTWEEGMTNPFVVKGDTIRSEREYTVKASSVFVKGELIRLTLAGTVAVAGTTVALGGAHGIALADAVDYITGGDYEGQKFPVALFTKDTVIGIQAMTGKHESDYAVGQSYVIARNATSKKWTITATSGATGPVVVDSLASEDAWFDEAMGSEKVRGIVQVSFKQANLDLRVA